MTLPQAIFDSDIDDRGLVRNSPSKVGVLCVLMLTLLTLFGAGCSSLRSTDPPRTASEQFLLSEAAARAVKQLQVDALRDRSVYVDDFYFQAPEKGYVIGELRAHLLKKGVRLMRTRDDAEIVLEARSRAVGIDRYDYLFGLVSVPLSTADATNTPYSTTVALPELPLYKFSKQRGIASISIVAFWTDTGELFSSSGPYVGRTNREDYWFFGFGPNTVGDIPPTEPEPE
jgi:hypothetical protein